jgi:tannase/feruloyl esterase
VKTRALAAAYYLSPATRTYWDGCSTGGRQGYKEAQNNPADYDGYLVGAPAFNWTKFITSELYPQIVYQRDLGGVALTAAQHTLVSGSAVSACDRVGGQHMGYILDPQSCHYDPTKDANVLCAGVAGNGVTGASADPGCVDLVQAQAFNKIWYG